MALSTATIRGLARAGGALAALALLLLVYDQVWQPLLGGELVLRSGPADPRAVAVTSLPGGEAFANHQRDKAGPPPLVVRLDLHPGDGPVSVVTRDWSVPMDPRFGPQLMELTEQRFTYAARQRERNRRTRQGRPLDPSLNLYSLGGRYQQEGLFDLEEGKAYYLLLPVVAGRAGDAYAVWVRKHAPGEPGGRLFVWAFVLLGAGVGLGLWFGRKLAAVPRDPVATARVFARWGRTAQARAVLEQAVRQQPHRRAEIEAELAKLR